MTDMTLDRQHEAAAARSAGRSLRVEVTSATHRGQVRANNEDAVLAERADSPVAERRGVLCVVADGMGGHAAGEVASSLAVQTTRQHFYASREPENGLALREAISAANEAVWREAQRSPDRAGMGCTISAAVVRGDEVAVGHVGDSRAYMVRRADITQITTDHSWVAEQVRAGALTPEQARQHPRRNVITRAIGQRASVAVDIYRLHAAAGDAIVLCSDGLSSVVEDDEIGRYARELPPQEAVKRLIDVANSRGAPDNVTVAVMRLAVDAVTSAGGRRPGWGLLGLALLLVVIAAYVVLRPF